MANYDTKSSKGMLKQQLSQCYYSKISVLLTMLVIQNVYFL